MILFLAAIRGKTACPHSVIASLRSRFDFQRPRAARVAGTSGVNWPAQISTIYEALVGRLGEPLTLRSVGTQTADRDVCDQNQQTRTGRAVLEWRRAQAATGLGSLRHSCT